MQESFRQYARSVQCKLCLNYDYLYIFTSYTPFTLSKNYPDHDLDSNLDCDLDCDPEDVPVYTGHPLFNTTKRITLLFVVQSLLHCNPSNISIEIIQIRTIFLDPDAI